MPVQGGPQNQNMNLFLFSLHTLACMGLWFVFQLIQYACFSYISAMPY